MPKDIPNHRQRPQRHHPPTRNRRNLNLALDQLNRRKQKRRENPRKRAGEPQRGQRQRGVLAGEPEAEDGVAAEALKEEERRGLDGGAEERGRDAAVEGGEAVGAQGLAEAVEGASVEEGEVGGLGLQADFDGVEGVFDVFAYYAGDLRGG